MIFIKKYKIVIRLLQMALIISTVISPIFLNCLGAYGMISNANQNIYNNPDMLEYQHTLMNNMCFYGYTMLFSSLLMIVSTVLCLCRFNIVPMIMQSTGFTICMVVMVKISEIADKYGLTDSELQPLSEKYFNRHFVSIVPLILLVLICLVRFFSYDERSKRRQKHFDKMAKEDAPCEKIVD